jgi:hypothetical protein
MTSSDSITDFLAIVKMRMKYYSNLGVQKQDCGH